MSSSAKTSTAQDLDSQTSRRAALQEDIIESPFGQIDSANTTRILKEMQEARGMSRNLRHNQQKSIIAVGHQLDLPSAEDADERANAKNRESKRSRRKSDRKIRRALKKQREVMKSKSIHRVPILRIKIPQIFCETRKELDRYLLVHTRGAYVLKKGRTISGRSRRRTLPEVSSYDKADLESMLAEIKKAGGTLGSHHIWGKSLAEISDQDSSYVPLDGGSILIEDPLREEIDNRNANTWNRREVLIFVDKYCSHEKNFRKIATFLENKNASQCVQFYYENKFELELKELLEILPSLKRKRIRNEYLLKLIGFSFNPVNFALFDN
eukprot:IDg6971t1